MLLKTGRYQVGSDACSPDRLLLKIGRYQVGNDACSPDRMLLKTGRYTRLAAMNARQIVRCEHGHKNISISRQTHSEKRTSVRKNTLCFCIRSVCAFFQTCKVLRENALYDFAFEPPAQIAEIVLNANENATKRTKTPGAWRARHQLVGL